MRGRPLFALVAVVALIALLPRPASAQAAPKIGVFDAQRVSEETSEGKRVQTQLTALQAKKRGELEAKQKELDALAQQLQAQGLSLSAEKRTEMDKDIQRKRLELQQAQEAAQNELQMELAEAQSKFQDQLLAVVEQFARSDGFSLIFEKSQVAFAAETVDVTSAIVDAFNRSAPPAATQPAAGQPGQPAPGQPPAGQPPAGQPPAPKPAPKR